MLFHYLFLSLPLLIFFSLLLFFPHPMYQRIILIKKGARIAHRYAQSHISHIGGITPFPSISCSFARRTDSHLS